MLNLNFNQFLELCIDAQKYRQRLAERGWEFVFSSPRGGVIEAMSVHGLSFGDTTVELLIDAINDIKSE